MDTLRHLAKLPSDRFDKSTTSSKLLQCLSARTYTHPARNRSWTVQEELAWRAVQNLTALEAEPDVSAALSLIKIPRDDNEIIGIPESSFNDIFSACRLDPRFLHLLRNNRYGLHYESWQRRHCYYIGTVLYTLMWSYNPRTRITRAILLLRDSGSTRSFSDFQRILEMESTRLHNPFFLAWVALVQLSNWVDIVTYSQLTTVRKLENTTGHGPYGGNPAANKLKQQEENMEELTKASRKVGSVLVDLANQTRHIAMGLSIASHLMSATKLDKLDMYTDDYYRDQFLEQLETFTSGIPSIKRSLTDSKEYVTYIQERTRNQATVIASLLTHEDARINIKLAQASKELAEAAKKDSSSMKTIAVMTMMFLPGTFFAAVWAIPSLQWDKPGVIQDNFWVYWAFTVPATVLVFAVWLGLHRWRYASISGNSISPSSTSSFFSSLWSRKRKTTTNGSLNVAWPSNSDYLPLAVGGHKPANASMQHLNDHLQAQTSVPFTSTDYEYNPTSVTYMGSYYNDPTNTHQTATAELSPGWVYPQQYTGYAGAYIPEQYAQSVPTAPTPAANHTPPTGVQASSTTATPGFTHQYGGPGQTSVPATWTEDSRTSPPPADRQVAGSTPNTGMAPTYQYTAAGQTSVPAEWRSGTDTQDWAQPSPLSPVGAGDHQLPAVGTAPQPYNPNP